MPLRAPNYIESTSLLIIMIRPFRRIWLNPYDIFSLALGLFKEISDYLFADIERLCEFFLDLLIATEIVLVS